MAIPAPLPLVDADDRAYAAELEHDSGALVRWEKADGGAGGALGLLGIRTVILCLVLCLGRTVSDGALHADSSRTPRYAS